MCKYCERRQDIKFGWNQPQLPYHNNTIESGFSNLSGNALDNKAWNAYILDYQTTQPVLAMTCSGFFQGDGIGTIYIPLKYCPECGRKPGKSILEKQNK